ncbi:hypothetical protein EOM39_02270, partial [Candidatus Gracilibacteria bacterium]|nr:hypothetical protein [Candidatus Gracilibacteria bacterium]
MSEQNIHVLTEEERKAIRDKKINAISFGKDVLPKPPYALVNGALELNPEILLDAKKTDKINVDLEKDDSMFEYEPEYGEDVNSKTEVVQKDTKIENDKIILDSNYDPATIKKYIKPKKNIFIRDLPTLKLPEDKNAIENNKIIEGKEIITKEINTGTKEETKIVEKLSEVKTETVIKPLVKVAEVKTEPVVKPLVKVAEEKTEPVVKPLVKVAEEKT